ncbi:MAG: hypothetical protein ACLRQF_18640 [Thomasclavelia ramosa]
METAKQYVNFGQPDDLKFKTEDFAISFGIKQLMVVEKRRIISNKDWSTGSNVGNSNLEIVFVLIILVRDVIR